MLGDILLPSSFGRKNYIKGTILTVGCIAFNILFTKGMKFVIG